FCPTPVDCRWRAGYAGSSPTTRSHHSAASCRASAADSTDRMLSRAAHTDAAALGPSPLRSAAELMTPDWPNAPTAPVSLMVVYLCTAMPRVGTPVGAAKTAGW